MVVARSLVARDILKAERVEILRADIRIRAWHDERDYFLAPIGMLAADDGAFENLRMRQQNFLDLARIDVGAARYYHVLRAVLECEEALRIGKAQITRPQPAIAQGLGIRLRVIPIAAHDAVRPRDDLADL